MVSIVKIDSPEQQLVYTTIAVRLNITYSNDEHSFTMHNENLWPIVCWFQLVSHIVINRSNVDAAFEEFIRKECGLP